MKYEEFKILELVLGHPPREHEVKECKKRIEELKKICFN
jgi:hypothetical protein